MLVFKVDLEVRGQDCEKAMKSKLSKQIVDILKHSMICTRQKAGFKIIIAVVKKTLIDAKKLSLSDNRSCSNL